MRFFSGLREKPILCRLWSINALEDYNILMKSFYLLNNKVRDYAWGHHQYIPDFLGIPNPDDNPYAELWMGAHPLASSRIDSELQGGIQQIDLGDFISTDSENILGPQITLEYGRLPYLLKLLAAGNALSIQAHPSKQMAEEGFKREDDAGIPRDAADRNYRDDNHKPEIIMAITKFTAMIGFRETAGILKYFSELKQSGKLKILLAQVSLRMRESPSEALQVFFEGILGLDKDSTDMILNAANIESKNTNNCWNPIQRRWVRQLAAAFPGDIGAIAPLFLHIVELQPGEALYQPARALHAYLEGFGLELMANSDNVLRGGLTKKHIDVPELMKVLKFEASKPAILTNGVPDINGISHYSTPTREFTLGTAAVSAAGDISLKSGRGPLIVLAMEGDVILRDGFEELKLTRGCSAFIPWNAREVNITGNGHIALAEVGSVFGSGV